MGCDQDHSSFFNHPWDTKSAGTDSHIHTDGTHQHSFTCLQTNFIVCTKESNIYEGQFKSSLRPYGGKGKVLVLGTWSRSRVVMLWMEKELVKWCTSKAVMSSCHSLREKWLVDIAKLMLVHSRRKAWVNDISSKLWFHGRRSSQISFVPSIKWCHILEKQYLCCMIQWLRHSSQPFETSGWTPSNQAFCMDNRKHLLWR